MIPQKLEFIFHTPIFQVLNLFTYGTVPPRNELKALKSKTIYPKRNDILKDHYLTTIVIAH